MTTSGGKIEPGRVEELESITADLHAKLDTPPAEPEPTPEDELVDLAVDKIEEVGADPAALERTLAKLTEEELAAVIELGFGLVADKRGAHWEISEKRSRRLAKWLKLVLQKHTDLWKWLAQWLPEAMLAALLSYEVWQRWRLDQEIAKKKKQQAPPPKSPEPEVPVDAAAPA